MHIINLVETGALSTPLYDVSMFPEGQMDNKIYVKALITDLIQKTFQHVQQAQFLQFVEGLFVNCKNLQKFMDHVHDFLIASKEVAGAEDLRLYDQTRETTSNISHLDVKSFEAKGALNSTVQNSLRIPEAAGAEDMAS